MENIKFEVIKKIAETTFRTRNLSGISKLDSNSPPSVFIGSKLKYPLVNVGILSPLDKDENAWLYDDEKYWANNDFQINDVIKIRESLLNSRFQSIKITLLFCIEVRTIQNIWILKKMLTIMKNGRTGLPNTA